MVLVFWSQPDAGSIVQPQSLPFLLFLRHFKPFLSPDPLHTFMVHFPAVPCQQDGNPSISVPPIITGKTYDILTKTLSPLIGFGLVSLG
jgi:hypothetical protein